jgi:hypothetical protein
MRRMGLRQWLRERMLEEDGGTGDVPPGSPLLQAVLGREEPVRALGEFTAATYPPALADVVRRREEVAAELMRMQLGDAEVRRAAVPRLQELLHRYPHPLAYEALILAYVQDARWEEARGAAFAARERRLECEQSPWPELRAECDRLRAWSPEDVDVLRDEREGRLVTPGVPAPHARPAPHPSPA